MFENAIPLMNVPVGPGSQKESEDDMVLDYMRMPSEMNSYDLPVLPEAEDAQQCPGAVALLTQLQTVLDRYEVDQPGVVLPMGELTAADQDLLNQILGEGEVSLVCETEPRVVAQETVLAGVWRLRVLDGEGNSLEERIEVADIPTLVRAQTFKQVQPLVVTAEEMTPELLNVPSVLTELAEQCENRQPDEAPHVVNLSLLPFSPADHAFLDGKLGIGPITILSRGYGNCRITSTRIAPLWRVQYFNSTDQLILDTLEITDIPAVACAAKEDLEDSAERLQEIREVLV